MASNTEIEMRWIDAWSEAYEIAGGRSDLPCLLPDGMVTDFDQGLGWLQEAAYSGYLVRVEAGWVGHRRGVILHRWLPDA